MKKYKEKREKRKKEEGKQTEREGREKERRLRGFVKIEMQERSIEEHM